ICIVLFLLCFILILKEFHIFYGRILDDKVSKKINLPHGLCVHKKGDDCPHPFFCDCCSITDKCYRTIDICVDECKKTSSSGTWA
ncbi:hypothetical protein ZWY2020_015755, partial [Hordeum vulgare]